MDSILSPSLPVQTGIPGSSACLQIEVLSGARRNPRSDFESTTIFLGSDPECDFILSGDYFPPMYAFLLVNSQGAVIRHLGGGPTLLLDTNPIERQRITTTATITAGPLAITLQVMPSAFIEGHCQKEMHRNLNIGHFHSSEGVLSADGSIQLIEQASRLLASIDRQESEDFTATVINQHTENSHDGKSTDIKLSIGRPATGQLPPIWHHICLN